MPRPNNIITFATTKCEKINRKSTVHALAPFFLSLFHFLCSVRIGHFHSWLLVHWMPDPKPDKAHLEHIFCYSKWNKTNHWQQIHVSASGFKSPCKNKDKFGTSWKIFSKGASRVQKLPLMDTTKCTKTCANIIMLVPSDMPHPWDLTKSQKNATLKRVSDVQRSRS